MKTRFAVFAVLALSMFSASASAEPYYYSAQAGGSGGSYFEDQCPYHYLKGVGVRAGGYIDRIQNYCPNSPNTSYYLESTYHGGGGGSFVPITCPSGFVVKGFYGRAGRLVDQLGVDCVEQADIDQNASYETIVRLSSEGGSGGSYYSFKCGLGDGAVGIFGRTGQYLDRIGLLCRDQGN